jgi:hypothetical protein
MDIKPFTPAIRMQRTALIRRTTEWRKQVAEDYGVSEDEVYLALMDFFSMSLRAPYSNGKMGFAFAVLSDDSAALQKKFLAYLNTSDTQTVWNIEAAIRTYDAPVDEILAPDAESADPE